MKYIINDIKIITIELYFLTILLIHDDNITNKIYVVKNHHALLYAEFINVTVNKNSLIFIGYTDEFLVIAPNTITNKNNTIHVLIYNLSILILLFLL